MKMPIFSILAYDVWEINFWSKPGPFFLKTEVWIPPTSIGQIKKQQLISNPTSKKCFDNTQKIKSSGKDHGHKVVGSDFTVVISIQLKQKLWKAITWHCCIWQNR